MSIIPIRKFVLRGTFTEKGSLVALKVQLELEIDNKKYLHEFYVVEKLIFQLIIGIDFLDRHGARIDFRDNKMILRLNQREAEQRIITVICASDDKTFDRSIVKRENRDNSLIEKLSRKEKASEREKTACNERQW